MGYNTVAILLNDNIAFGADDPNLWKAIQSASRGWSEREHDHLATRISTRSGNCIGASYGQIISQDHADGYQVVVVHGNTGWRLDEAENDKYLGWQAFDLMKDCFERNGYRVTKRRKQTEARAILADRDVLKTKLERTREALAETLAVATRNETGEFADRARAILSENPENQDEAAGETD